MGQLLAPPGPHAVHLCIDMQRLFAPGAPWATPWLERALPEAVRLIAHTPRRTVFTRFIPVHNKAEARGVWKIYYEKWECVTRDKVDPVLLELMPTLTRFVPPATVIDRQTYCAFTNGRLQAFLDEHQVDTLIVSGGEPDVCVLATVLAAVDIGYRVILAEDALCSSSDESHDALINLYSKRFSLQIEVTPVASILASWSVDDWRPVICLPASPAGKLTRLIEEASRCRRLAASINDWEAASKIEALAADYERRVAALAASKEAKPVKGADES